MLQVSPTAPPPLVLAEYLITKSVYVCGIELKVTLVISDAKVLDEMSV
jgi:hypothetical protein